VHDSTISAPNPILARGIQQISDVGHCPTTAALDPRPCPRCGVIDTPEMEDLQPDDHIFDPILSAVIDHLLLIETELITVRRLLEEALP
jgi:hypothetical protein